MKRETHCRWLILLLLAISTTLTNSKELRVVCYYTNWSVYRPGTAKFGPQNINPYLCTHLVYAFGGFTKENTLKPFDKYQDIEKGGYAKFTGLKTYNKNLKTMLAIGGWNEGSSRFSPMVANAERRKELVKNAVKFLRQNHFDGLDLDWEYPAFRDGGKPRDKDNYAQLVQELREEFERESEKTGRPRLLLTMAVPAGIEYINKGYDVPKLMKYLDWMNILSYDYHSAFEPAVNHHAPLYALEEASEYNYDAELTIDYTIKHYLEAGAEASKLVLGIPTYGRSYTLYNPEANEIGAPADGPGDMGDATRENGYLAYYEICQYVKSEDWIVVQPNPEAMGPYAYKENQWVGYDDEAVARKKAQYVADKGLGGIMFWSIDNDDFRGECHGKPYPLIEAAKEALVEAYGLTEDNSISAPAKPIKTKPRTRGKVTASTTETTKNSGGRQGSTSNLLRKRHRTTPKPEEKEQTTTRNKVQIKKDRLNSRRKSPLKTSSSSSSTTTSTTTSSSLIVTPSYTTPAPPPTPDPGSDFKCEEEGFYPHPRDCKKYFWCLSSGPSDLGIVAHQFTCPSGLYFNKAADSCDYTQNVRCSKKSTKTTTTTTTTEKPDVSSSTTVKSSSVSRFFSTTRAPPKITAATSRTTFTTTTTTTAAPEEYEEYEYENEEVNEDRKLAEEDPKVIKELIDLIKKAGGLEELEKHIKIHDDGNATISSSEKGSTTQSSVISRSLYERVLSRANAKSNEQTSNSGGKKDTRQYSSINRNSRGPQNEGLNNKEEKEKASTSAKGRPQYTSISRNRPSTTSKPEETDEKEVEDTKTVSKKEESVSQRPFRRQYQPEYVTIRRNRPSTSSTTESQTTASSDTEINKKLGEVGESSDVVVSSTQIPEYINLRRQRPTTAQDTTTSKYKTIRRGSTTASASTTTESTTTAKKSNSEKSTTTTEASDIGNNDASETKDTINTVKLEGPNTLTSEEKPADVIKNTNIPSNLIPSSSIETTEKVLSSTEVRTEPSFSTIDKITPQLFEPRPFSLNPRKKPSTAQTETSTQATKVSESISSTTPRVRPHGFRELYDVNNLNTENTSKDTTHTRNKHTKQRGQSRFTPDTVINRNRIRSYTPEEASQDTNQEHLHVRTRNGTRFTPPSSTEAYQEDKVRTFRPNVVQEISDLSSLTAVDFSAKNKRVFPTRGGSYSRRNRNRATETSSTPSVEAASTTASHFRRGQRANHTLYSNSANEASVRRTNFRSLHRSAPKPVENEQRRHGVEEETARAVVRNRKIIRKLNNTTPVAPAIAEVSDVQNNTSPAPQNNDADAVATTEYDLNVEEHNSSLATNLSPTVTKLSKTENTVENEDDREDILKSNEEEENIKLSESNIRENSDVSGIHNGNVIQEANVKHGKLATTSSKLEETSVPVKSTTESNIIIRTRKIIRKLQPTESALHESSTTEASVQTRPRKVIRRLRPGQHQQALEEPEIPTKESKNVEADIKHKKPYFVRRKPETFGRVSTENTNVAEKPLETTTENARRFVPNSHSRRRFPLRNRTSVISNKENNAQNVSIENVTLSTERISFSRAAVEHSEAVEHNAALSESDGVTIPESFTAVPDEMPQQVTDSFEKETSLPTDQQSSTASKLRGKYRPHLRGLTTERSNEQNSTNDAVDTNKEITSSLLEEDIVTTETSSPVENINTVPSRNEDSYTTANEISQTESELSLRTTDLSNDILLETTTLQAEEQEITTLEAQQVSSSEKPIVEIVTEAKELPLNPAYKGINSRPKYTVPKRLSSSSTPPTERTQNSGSRNAYSNRRPSRRPAYISRTSTESSASSTSSVPRRSHLLYNRQNAYSSRKRVLKAEENENLNKEIEESAEPELKQSEDSQDAKAEGEVNTDKRYGVISSNSNKDQLVYGTEPPSLYENPESHQNRYKEKHPLTNSAFSNKRSRNFISRRSTTAKPIDNLEDIDVSAVNQRNKNLFNKPRKMNIPHYGTTEAASRTFTTESTETATDLTSLDVPETTEQQTTLLHVFAVTESLEEATAALNETEGNLSNNNKTLEKLVEISRIVEVYSKEEKLKHKSDLENGRTTVEAIPVLDRLGVINRVVEIKVVGGGKDTNLTDVENEIRQKSHSDKKGRKYEIYGDSKVNDFSNKINVLSPGEKSKQNQAKLEIIDSKSHVKTITPNPLFNDASTIALETLFLTGSPRKINSDADADEVLHTQNSNIVNIRLLNQDDDSKGRFKLDPSTDFVPLRILKPDLEMKAKVVEVIPETSKNMIKIAPIALQRVGINFQSPSQHGNSESKAQKTTVVFPVKPEDFSNTHTDRNR